jgi:hypothetical protein
MSRRAQENLIATALLLLFVAVLVMSFGYGPRARLVPVPIAIIAILLTAGQLLWQNLRAADELHVDVLELVTGRDGSNRRRAAQSDAAAPQPHSLAAQARAFGIVAALLALFLVLGPLPAIFLFSVGYFILGGDSSWLRGLAYACLCTGLLYLIFGFILQVQLNRGLIAPLIGQYVTF